MNMFKPVKAADRSEYIAMLNEDRRAHIEKIDELIRKTAPALKPHFAYNMLGYGTFKYQNSKKEFVDWQVIGLASQKNYISLYVCCVVNGRYLAEQYKDALGKVSVGKSCIRFKKFEDLNVETLKQLLVAAEKNPGMEKA